MNFLAGFLIITCADSIVADRDTDSDDSPHDDYKRLGVVAGSGGVSRDRDRDRKDKKEKDREVVLTEEEVELVEIECGQVMLGLVALQGGVLSRDLCGLHAVRDLDSMI